MRLIIDIPEETYKKCKWKNNGVVGLEWWERAIVNGTPGVCRLSTNTRGIRNEVTRAS